jgi:2-succinyl-6-hydroxy-2,4-cyclohexadiene-1-carboxylate synthase
MPPKKEKNTSSAQGDLTPGVHWFYKSGGVVVCLLHGFTGDVHAWDEVAAYLPRHISVAGLYLPGHHPDVPAQTSFEATCDAIARSLQALRADALRLVGYSLGARLALGIALRHPKLLQRVTLVSGHIGLQGLEDRQTRHTLDAHWVALLNQEGIESFVDAWERQAIFASQTTLSEMQRQNQRQQRLRHHPQALAQSLQSAGLAQMPDYWPQLSSIAIDVAYIVGRADAKFSAIARRAHALTPHATLDFIDGCGHNPLLEVPEKLADLIAGVR